MNLTTCSKLLALIYRRGVWGDVLSWLKESLEGFLQVSLVFVAVFHLFDLLFKACEGSVVLSFQVCSLVQKRCV